MKALITSVQNLQKVLTFEFQVTGFEGTNQKLETRNLRLCAHPMRAQGSLSILRARLSRLKAFLPALCGSSLRHMRLKAFPQGSPTRFRPSHALPVLNRFAVRAIGRRPRIQT